MKGRPSVWTRTARLARTACCPDDLDAMVRLIAAEAGTTPEQVLAEVAEFGARSRAAGTFTLKETVAFLAAELGLPPREVVAEARALLEAVR